MRRGVVVWAWLGECVGVPDQVRRRVYLDGEELARYRQKEREEKAAKQLAAK